MGRERERGTTWLERDDMAKGEGGNVERENEIRKV